MRPLALLLLLLPGCFTTAPPVDDAVAEEDSSSDGGESEGGEESSSSGDAPSDPLDAYGPCEVDADCELIPGDEGQVGDSVRCVQGTCAIRCADADAPLDDYVCPGYFVREPVIPQAPRAIICQEGYCTIQFDPYGDAGSMSCPDGMQQSDTMTVPQLDCVWEP